MIQDKTPTNFVKKHKGLLIGVGIGTVCMIITGFSIWWLIFRDSDGTGDGDGNKPIVRQMKARLSINPITGKDTSIQGSFNNSNVLSNANKNAQNEIETNAIRSQEELNTMLDSTESNVVNLNSTITLIEEMELSNGFVDPLILDGVSIMGTLVEESKVLTEEAIIANLEIKEIMAETEGNIDTIETIEEFEGENQYLNTKVTPPTNTNSPYRNSNSTFESDSNYNSEFIPSNSLDSRATVRAQERASRQGTNDNEGNITIDVGETQYVNLGNISGNIKIGGRTTQSRSNSNVREKKRLASSLKLNEKQVLVEIKLNEKIQEREAKMTRIEEKTTQKRIARHSRKEARDLIKQIRMSIIADIKGKMENKGRIINQFNYTIKSILSGEGNSEGKYIELLQLIQKTNSDYTPIIDIDGNGNMNGI